MRRITITVYDDVYFHIMQNKKFPDKSMSDTLRRLLKIKMVKK